MDYVDHTKRKLKFDLDLVKKKQLDFKPIEAIVLLGEPVHWERALQIIVDVLMTDGDPRNGLKHSEALCNKKHSHLPMIVCNKDLTFKGAAKLPR